MKYRVLVFIFFIVFCTLFILRLKSEEDHEIKPKKNYYFSGRISQVKKLSDNNTSFKLGKFNIFLSGVDEFPHLQRGDLTLLFGAPEIKVINSFHREFWLINPEIKQIETVALSPVKLDSIFYLFLNRVDDLRIRMEKIIFQALPVKEAGLLAGIVLGSQENLPPNFYQSLKLSGTLHIVVASGMNVTIIGKIVLDIFVRRFKRTQAIFVTLFCILIYTFLAGAEPPIVRAAIMGSVAFTAQVFGRQYWAAWSLLLTLAVMLLGSPTLLFEIGFQLSAVATAGLLFVSPEISKVLTSLISRVEKLSLTLAKIIYLFRLDLTETLAAQLAVMPLLLVHFGQFNFLAFLPNVLIATLVPILMRLGGILIGIGFISQTLTQLMALIVWVPLKYTVLVIEFFGKVSWLNLEWQWPWWLALVYWLGLFSLLKDQKARASQESAGKTLRNNYG